MSEQKPLSLVGGDRRRDPWLVQGWLALAMLVVIGLLVGNLVRNLPPPACYSAGAVASTGHLMWPKA